MFSKVLSDRKMDVLIVLISFLLIIAVFNLPFKAKPFGDMTFHTEAQTLALYLKGATNYSNVVITKAPGPVLFYAVAYLFAPLNATDHQLWFFGLFFNAIIAAISPLLLYRAAKLMLSKEIALLTLLLIFIFPLHIYYSFAIMGETPAFFSLSLAIYGWALAYKKQRKLGWLLLALGIWFLILNRPNALLLPALGISLAGFSFFFNKPFFNGWGRPLVLSMLLSTIASFGILQMAKSITGNKVTTDQDFYFYYVAHQGRYEFREEPTDLRYWESNSRPDSKDYQDWKKHITILDQQMKATGKSFKEVYRDFLITDALEHPFWLTRQFFVKCMYGNLYFVNSVKPENFKLGLLHGKTGFWIVMFLINIANLLVLIGAVIFLVKEKQRMPFWIFWCAIAALLIFHGLTYMEPRYLFPSRAALYVVSAAGLCRIAFVQKGMSRLAALIYGPVLKA
jgi:hypothetical protein